MSEEIDAPLLKKDELFDAPVEDKKFAVVEDEIAPEAIVEEVVAVPSPEPTVTPTNAEVVEVYADKIIYKNKMAKRSMSVWQVQRRLDELGYNEIRKAKAGYYEEITQGIVDDYRADNKLGAGQIDEKFLKALFKGDKSVKLILS